MWSRYGLNTPEVDHEASRSHPAAFLTKSGMVLGAAALGPLLPDANLWRLGRGLWLPAAYASTVLDPTNPSNFKQDDGVTRSAIAAAAYPDRTRRWGPQCHRRGPGGWSLAWADSASHEW
jgi:hypothetical protein